MADLMVLAWQTDMTRVITFQMGHEMSGRAYPELGFGDAHHPCTHHQGDREKQEKTTKINILHTKMLSYYLGRLRDTPDGDGSLLDHSMILYGAGLSDANLHLYTDLSLLLVAGGVGGIKGGQHVRYPNAHADDQSAPHHAGQGRCSARGASWATARAGLDLPTTVEGPRGSASVQTGSPRAATFGNHADQSGRMAMNTRATILAALMGSTMFAGAALAAGASDMSLVTAAKQGDRAAVQSLLNGRAKQDVAGAEGTAALVWAATRNDLAMADLLLRAGANVKAANEFGATALYAAAAHAGSGDDRKAAGGGRRCQYGPDVGRDAAHGSGPPGQPRDGACVALERNANPNARESNGGQTALMWALSQRQSAVVEELLKRRRRRRTPVRKPASRR